MFGYVCGVGLHLDVLGYVCEVRMHLDTFPMVGWNLGTFGYVSVYVGTFFFLNLDAYIWGQTVGGGYI